MSDFDSRWYMNENEEDDYEDEGEEDEGEEDEDEGEDIEDREMWSDVERDEGEYHDEGDSEDEEDSDDEDEWDYSSTEMRRLLSGSRNSVVVPQSDEVVLQEGLWEQLSDELVCRILSGLPVRAQCRFRSVCVRWNTLLSPSSTDLQQLSWGNPRPSCTILSSDDWDDVYWFCHGDHKWFHIPFDMEVPLPWFVADVDSGLLCYDLDVKGKLWFTVCNPVTMSFQQIPPHYPPLNCSPAGSYTCKLLKLIVDEESKTFRVIVLVYARHPRRPVTTVMFDSRTSSWNDFQCVPSKDFKLKSRFVHKGVIYVRTSHPAVLKRLDIKSGKWSQIETELPCDSKKGCFLISNRDQVMFVELRPMEEEPVLVWKHMDNVPEEKFPLFSARRWKKLHIGSHPALKTVVGGFKGCFSHGSEYLCFTRDSLCVKYTFATRTWNVMPDKGSDQYPHKWYVWEPTLEHKWAPESRLDSKGTSTDAELSRYLDDSSQQMMD